MATAKDSATDAAEGIESQVLDETPGLEDIAASFSDVPDDAKVTLYRRQEDTSKWGVLDHMAPDMFSVDGTAQKHGPGTYRAIATARVKNKPGRPRVASVQFVVDPDVKWNGAQPAAGASSGSKLSEVVEASYMQALSSMMQTMQATADAAKRPESTVDWVAVATAASPIIVALLEKRSDPLETAAKLVELTRPDGKAPEFSQLFDVFSQGLDFASDQRPDSLGRIADTVTQLVERTAGQKTEEAPKVLQPGATESPPQQQQPPAGPPGLEALRPFFPYLIKVAVAEKNPQLYAEWLVDQLPPDAVPAIVSLTAEPAFPENVVAVLPPQIAHLANWFRALCLEVARILEHIQQPETPPPASSAQDGPTFARPPLSNREPAGDQSEEDPAAEEDTAADED